MIEKTIISQNELILLRNKISDAEYGMGVIVNKGKVLKHKSDTNLLAKVEKERPETICGFYNSNIKIEDLKEDLEYMGVRII